MTDIEERVLERLKEEEPDSFIISELTQMVTDRLCIRLGAEELPSVFDSIAVDAAIKAYRRAYYEGITSESAGSITTSFCDDILKEYQTEIDAYKNSTLGSGKVVHFL